MGADLAAHIYLLIQHSNHKVNQASEPQKVIEQQIAWQLLEQFSLIPPIVVNNPGFIPVNLLPTPGNFH